MIALCPCGSQLQFNTCCEPYLLGIKPAPTPEALMRSRYTAFTNADTPYLAATMISPAKDDFDLISAEAFTKQVTWLELKILFSETKDNIGYVEFIARYRINSMIQKIHELSEFHLIDQQWFYAKSLKSPTKTSNKTPGRNELCPCGSGKKYKKCCSN